MKEFIKLLNNQGILRIMDKAKTAVSSKDHLENWLSFCVSQVNYVVKTKIL